MRDWIAGHSSLRLRLLLAMVTSVVAISAMAMALDYRHERRRGLDRISLSLEEQASALRAAYVLMTDSSEFGRYVDEFCATMDERISPGHHILVLDTDGSVFASSRQHSGQSAERALLRTTSQQGIATVDGHRLAYVRSSDTGGHVFILAQYLDQMEAALHDRLVRRSISLFLIAVTIALFIYLAIAFWVIGPLEKLIHTAQRWSARDFSARVPFSGPSDIQVVAREFNSMAEDLETHEQRRQQELDEARQIQSDLLPKFPDEVSGLRLAAEYRPATDVAGDLYDVFTLPDGKIALAVLDVSGHGISAAMLTGLAKISLRRCLTEQSHLPEALRQVNADILACTSDGYFVTACVGVWNPRRSRWTYCAAGHPGGVLIRRGKAIALPSTAPLLGILPDGEWAVNSLTLSPRDRVFLYTDGIVESQLDERQFGLDGLEAVLRKTSHRSLYEQASAVIEAVSPPDARQLNDDATILAFEFHAATATRVSATT